MGFNVDKIEQMSLEDFEDYLYRLDLYYTHILEKEPNNGTIQALNLVDRYSLIIETRKTEISKFYPQDLTEDDDGITTLQYMSGQMKYVLVERLEQIQITVLKLLLFYQPTEYLIEKAKNLIPSDDLIMKRAQDMMAQRKDISSEDNKSNEPLIQVDPDYIDEIINDLGAGIAKQKDTVRSLLKGDSIDDPIIYYGTAKMITTSFRKYKEVNHWISATQTNLSEWLIKNFKYLKRSDIKPLSRTTVWKYLTAEEYKQKN